MCRAFACFMILLVAGSLIVAGYVCEAAAVPAPQPGSFRWEYKVYKEVDLANLTDEKTLEAALNKLGDEGWELVAIKSVYETPAMAAKRNSQALFVLKRLKKGK
jgi:uncharacterized protein DUF4177